MARRRRRAEDDPRPVGGYIEPSSPQRPPTSCLYFHKDGRDLIVNFCHDGASARYLELVGEGEGSYRWRKDEAGRHAIIYESGLVARASSLEELERIIETEPLAELPDPHERNIAHFKSDHVREYEPHLTRKQKRALRENTPREPKPARLPKPDTSGLLGVSWLAEKLGVEGKDVRVALRAQVKKPDIGWLWDPAEAEKIAKSLKLR